jgi:hypothetical protein
MSLFASEHRRSVAHIQEGLDSPTGDDARADRQHAGVRREGVTEGALELQHAGLIQYARGHVTVLSSPRRLCTDTRPHPLTPDKHPCTSASVRCHTYRGLARCHGQWRRDGSPHFVLKGLLRTPRADKHLIFGLSRASEFRHKMSRASGVPST